MAMESSSFPIHTHRHLRMHGGGAALGMSTGCYGNILGEIEEVADEVPEKVYVAVDKRFKEGKETLMWAINHTSRREKIVIVHVHRHPKWFSLMGGMFSENQLSEEQVRACKQQERQKADKSLNEYLIQCSHLQRRAEKLVIEMDDIGKGIIELIAQHRITKLVMGASADRHYSRKMKAPRSRTAINVQQQADPSCKIWFVCKGNLICTSGSSTDQESTFDNFLSNINSLPISRDDDLPLVSSTTPIIEPDKVGMDDDVYEKLQEALKEAEDSKHEAYLESFKRQEAEKAAIDAWRKARTSVNSYGKELERREGIETRLARAKTELGTVEAQRNKVIGEVEKTSEHNLELELKVADSGRLVKELGDKLSETRRLLVPIREDQKESQRELDNVVSKAEELHREKEGAIGRNVAEFAYSELKRATNNFADSVKIGDNGYGKVYKGFLRHTTVAIKMINPERIHDFFREVDILSQARHLHLVSLIGKCSEASAIVYEHLPNGSLDDRLACKDNTPPLSWQTRTRIIAEVCSAITFLHSNKPHRILHGSIKPENILLDSHFASRLGGFGSCRSLAESDATGSDVYSFGVMILRILTGRPASVLVSKVKEAVDTERLHEMLDVSAGDWPFIQAKQLAELALRCCHMQHNGRIDLSRDVLGVLEPMMMTVSEPTALPLRSALGKSCVPPLFICPIFREMMRDPQIAADGFTYEGEAIRGWLDSGYSTSPMTNLKFSHRNLIPNHALRSAIQQWLQQQN